MVGISDVEEVAGLGAKIGRKLKPPQDDDTAVTAWRWFVVVVLTCDTLLLIGHIAVACGFLPFLNTGFAYQKDLVEVQRAIYDSRVERLENRIYNMRIRQCDAISRGESPRLYTLQLNESTKQYRALTSHDAYLASCSELEMASEGKVSAPGPEQGDTRHSDSPTRSRQPPGRGEDP